MLSEQNTQCNVLRRSNVDHCAESIDLIRCLVQFVVAMQDSPCFGLNVQCMCVALLFAIAPSSSAAFYFGQGLLLHRPKVSALARSRICTSVCFVVLVLVAAS